MALADIILVLHAEQCLLMLQRTRSAMSANIVAPEGSATMKRIVAPITPDIVDIDRSFVVEDRCCDTHVVRRLLWLVMR